MLSPPITTAQRHPDHALAVNRHGTAPPTPCYHNGTATPDHAPPTNLHGTAPPRPRYPHQSPRHSATQTTLSPPITTAQRHPDQALPAITTARRHPDQALPSNPNGTAPPSFAQATRLEANPKGTAHRAQNERARSLAVVRGRSRPQSRNRNEQGPAPRPPRQKQEPFATHSGKNNAGPHLGSEIWTLKRGPRIHSFL